MTEKRKHIQLIIVLLIAIASISLGTFTAYKFKNYLQTSYKEKTSKETVVKKEVLAEVPDYIDKQKVIDVMVKARLDLIDEAGGREPDKGAVRLAQLQKAHEYIKDNYSESIRQHLSPNEEIINAEVENIKANNPNITEDMALKLAKAKTENEDIDTYIAFLLDTIAKDMSN